MTAPAAELMQRLGLSDDELCEVLDVDPLTVITGALDHRPELAILLALTAEASERVGPQTLRSWLRRSGPNGVPLEHLRSRDFAAFEDDLAVLAERGYVLRGSEPGEPSDVRPAAPRRCGTVSGRARRPRCHGPGRRRERCGPTPSRASWRPARCPSASETPWRRCD
jgi:hypothetical protein